MISPAAAMSTTRDRAVLHVSLADPDLCKRTLEQASQAWRELAWHPPAARALAWFAWLERLPGPPGLQVRRQSSLEQVERVTAMQEELERLPAAEQFCLPCEALAVWSNNRRCRGCSHCQPPPPPLRPADSPSNANASAPAPSARTASPAPPARPRAATPERDLIHLQERFLEVGYTPRRPELLALLAALHRGGPRVFLLEGQPGTGKTFLAESWSKILRTPCLYLLCHCWLSAEELQTSISVSAAVRGAAHEVDQPGFLCDVARMSQKTPVVAILDEVDKAPERVENLLLDFLQNGRVPGPKGLEQANPDNLWVFLTSNGIRPLGHALLRRCCRLALKPLPEAVEVSLMLTRLPDLGPLAGMLVRLANRLREGGHSSPSLHELGRCAADLRALLVRLPGVLTREDLMGLLTSWLGKEPEEEEILSQGAEEIFRVLPSLKLVR